MVIMIRLNNKQFIFTDDGIRIIDEFVYFMVDREWRCAIKIGISIHPGKRRSQVQADVRGKIELLATVPGYAELESELHAMFQPVWLYGEWFEPSDDLLDYILTTASPDRDLQTKIDAIREQRNWPADVLWAAAFFPLGEPIPTTRDALINSPFLADLYWRNEIANKLMRGERSNCADIDRASGQCNPRSTHPQQNERPGRQPESLKTRKAKHAFRFYGPKSR
jgi:hypothetical protein